jgi:SPP1 gp7 family putative phage head morphogenesis protein
MAAGWIQRIIAGSATDVGRLLATLESQGASEAEMVSQVQALVGATDVSAVSLFMDQAVSQAMSQASLDLYRAENVQLVDFVSAGDGRVCAICSDAEQNSPYTPDRAPTPGLHPNCRCVLQPADPLSASAYAAYLS